MSNSHESGPPDRPKRAFITVIDIRAHPGWWLLGLASVTMVLLWWVDAAPLLRYDRGLILRGEVWRLVTGHWVHGGFRHMALNVVGAWIIALLFTKTYSVRQWLFILAVGMAAIDGGFLAFEPQLQWYVGASGVLHSALAAGAVAWWRVESRGMALALTAVMIGKLTWEQVHGALPFVGSMPVIVDAHLYGAIGGTVAAVLLAIVRRRSAGGASAARL